MRSFGLLSALSGVSLAAMAALFAACSSAPSASPSWNGGSVESSSSGGSGSSGGASSGSPSGGSGSGGTSTAGSGSGSTTSGSSGTGSSGGTASSSGSSSGSAVSASTTWADGMTISEATTIPAGVTVAIANGATITVSAGVAITVEGALTATAGTPHAIMTGSGWKGIVIPSGGTITADSLDITGAHTPMDVSGTVTYDNGTITAPTVPLLVETSGSLSMTGSTITGSLGSSSINGALTLSKFDYDANGNEGLTMGDPSAVVTIDNSNFHGNGPSTADMLVTNQCASLTTTYTVITGCHCAYHFNNITSFDLENMDLHGDSYGFMMYGSSPTGGARVFKNSNVETMTVDGISELGTNGAISISGVYFDSSSKLSLTDQEITVSSPASSPLPGTEVGPQLAQ
jgi:hypothetical protein